MKKNIDKPKLCNEEKAVLAAQIKTMFQISIMHSNHMSWREKRGAKKIQKKIEEEILFGDWESAILFAMENKDFAESFRHVLEIVLKGGEPALKRRNMQDEDIQTVMLATMKFGKVYEYLTGRDVKTGKRIHKGAVDA